MLRSLFGSSQFQWPPYIHASMRSCVTTRKHQVNVAIVLIANISSEISAVWFPRSAFSCHSQTMISHLAFSISFTFDSLSLHCHYHIHLLRLLDPLHSHSRRASFQEDEIMEAVSGCNYGQLARRLHGIRRSRRTVSDGIRYPIPSAIEIDQSTDTGSVPPKIREGIGLDQ